MIEQRQLRKERKTLMGCVNTLTGKVIAQAHDKGNAVSFLKFLKKILKTYEKQKVTLVLDNVRYHHAKLLKPFLEKNKDRIELMFLPPYSPDFNPMERVWWYMRKKITHNRAVVSMKTRLINFWQMFSHFQKTNQEIVKVCNLNLSV
jgi:transposase